MPGRFITFEGGEGSGKTTQIKLLHQAFRNERHECVMTREPGGTPGAEAIRQLLVNGEAARWDPMAETLLFYAARLDHVHRLISPALSQNKTVLSDRFADSTRVYQGIGKNLSATFIENLHRLTLEHFTPDLTIVLDIDPAIGLKRAGERKGGEARFEGMDMAFHQNVRAGFLSIAQKEPKRCAVVPVSDIAGTHAAIIALVNARLGITLAPCNP